MRGAVKMSKIGDISYIVGERVDTGNRCACA